MLIQLKHLLFGILICFPFLLSAQYLVLTPYGLRNIKDTSKTYVVLDSLGMDSIQLFKKATNYIKETYMENEMVYPVSTNLSTIYKSIDNEFIRFHGWEPYLSKTPRRFLFKVDVTISTLYWIDLRFKNDRMKIEVKFNEMNTGRDVTLIQNIGTAWNMGHEIYIWDKNLVLTDIKMKTDIENFFNKKIIEIKKYIKNNDW